MYGFLRRPRWIAFLLLVVVLVVAFLELAAWQQRRHDGRSERNDRIAQSAEQAPVPVEQLLSPDAEVGDALQWRQVVVEGRWDQAGEVVVRNRPRDGRPGYLVVTPLRPDSGPALLVERGWVPAGETAAAPSEVPAAQGGDVTVVARLRPAEDAEPAEGLPAGQVQRIDPVEIGGELGYPVYAGFGELVSETPEPAEQPLLPAAPEPSAGPHLGYAVQWVLFACVAVGGLVVLVRREAEYLREQRVAADDQSSVDESVGLP